MIAGLPNDAREGFTDRVKQALSCTLDKSKPTPDYITAVDMLEAVALDGSAPHMERRAAMFLLGVYSPIAGQPDRGRFWTASHRALKAGEQVDLTKIPPKSAPDFSPQMFTIGGGAHFMGGNMTPAPISGGDEDGPLTFTFEKCSICLKKPEEGQKFKKCSRCKGPRYCSVACQRKDWGVHKRDCEPPKENAK